MFPSGPSILAIPVTWASMLLFGFHLLLGQLHYESGTLARPTLGGDAPSVALRNSPAYSQAHTGALIGRTPAVEPLKGLKNPVEVVFIKANSVVFHTDFPEPT